MYAPQQQAGHSWQPNSQSAMGVGGTTQLVYSGGHQQEWPEYGMQIGMPFPPHQVHGVEGAPEQQPSIQLPVGHPDREL